MFCHNPSIQMAAYHRQMPNFNQATGSNPDLLLAPLWAGTAGTAQQLWSAEFLRLGK